MSEKTQTTPQSNASVDKLRNRIGLLKSQISQGQLTGQAKTDAEARIKKDEAILATLLPAMREEATNSSAAIEVVELRQQVTHLIQQNSVLKEGIASRDQKIEELTALLTTEADVAAN